MKKTHLCVRYEDGTVLKGEGVIDEDNIQTSRIEKAYLDPHVNPNQNAIERIKESDFIIIGPGDLYTSIIPVLLVEGIQKALKNSKAKILFVMNLMTKAGQTTAYKAHDFIKDITLYLERAPDYVFVNNGSIPENILDWYKEHDESPVENDLQTHQFMGRIVEGDIINRNHVKKNTSDTLTRSILRHDSERLSELLMEIL